MEDERESSRETHEREIKERDAKRGERRELRERGKRRKWFTSQEREREEGENNSSPQAGRHMRSSRRHREGEKGEEIFPTPLRAHTGASERSREVNRENLLLLSLTCASAHVMKRIDAVFNCTPIRGKTIYPNLPI